MLCGCEEGGCCVGVRREGDVWMERGVVNM